MQLPVREIQDGPGPNEKVVGVTTANGRTEELIVDRRDIQDSNIEVGAPISQKNGHVLVELPREAMSGLWRVWITEESRFEQ